MSHFASWALLWPRHMAHHYSHMLRCKGRKFAKKPSPYERWERGDTTQIITRHNRPRQINVELTWNTVFGFSSRKLWFSKSKLNIDISKLNYFGTFHSKKKMWYFNILFLFRRKIMLKYCCVIFFFFSLWDIFCSQWGKNSLYKTTKLFKVNNICILYSVFLLPVFFNLKCNEN